MNAISRACEIVGGVSKMARLLRVSVPTVSQWVKEKRKVPLEHCPYIETLTRGKVTCEDLLPERAEFFSMLSSRTAEPRTAVAQEGA